MPISPEKMKLYPGGSIRSPEWLAIRARILQRARGRCEKCRVRNYALGGRRADGTFLKAHAKGEKLLRLEYPQPGETWWCGPRKGVLLRIIRIVLTIAHLDFDETNNADENLKALCQRCHNLHDLPQRRANARARLEREGGQGRLFA